MLQRERIDVLVLCVAFCCRFYTLAKSVQDYDDFTAAIGWDLSTSAVVLRGNKLDEINITDIVPGDVVHLSQVGRKLHSRLYSKYVLTLSKSRVVLSRPTCV